MASVAGTARGATSAKTTTKTRRHGAQRRVASGVASIVLVALLLAGVVALNVAVLRLNLELDDLGRKRATLRAENAALASTLASSAAAARIQQLAARQLGVRPATPEQTRFVDINP